MRRRFRSEFDYAREAVDMDEMREALARGGGGHGARGRVVAPRPLLALTTERVLVMEYLEGEKLLTSVQRRLRRALGNDGYTYARAHAMGLAPPPGVRRPS
eukprot:4668592-Prymnesium_polylepis.1